ncbi:hypothetical protein GW933_00845 [Candidatus Falkowbacteria bacterium]|uniref:Thymidylate synthase n=1 Tax=Candidatus Buchananbacteria bacterium CG10_big_fil_rev_8_21_14_0_10_33_19 TaxID=1974525 RepID=A0A2H0W5C5_9BACT|nr:hypothetical protein [Candidatus Falkowbacteria bacterium]PIS05801.1 MAG: hypothetical protein COT80_03475 [Candidatus Buchananbacteria bacterium CG10_big_fil_rev_8_21_14_0_10_33_19]
MNKRLLEIAKEFIFSDLEYSFDPVEDRIISRFFTNTNGRIFFIHSLPENMISSLLAMYSRMKNERGLRGMFVDSFLPQALGSLTLECQNEFNGDPAKFVKERNICSLEEFITYSEECFNAFKEFSLLGVDPLYLASLTASKKMDDFLKKWLDQYGHNSIARTAGLHICFEQISILAAKSIEWCRPGAAYIELSTRYVDMGGTAVYPIENELAFYGIDPGIIKHNNDVLYDFYRMWQGENFTGPFPTFLRDTYTPQIPDATAAQINMGVIGETCDVLGNFLPSSTLTSVGITISGESFTTLIKHLLLDGTPENQAIVEMVTTEAKKIGADQFLRHTEITDFDVMNWGYLSKHDGLKFVFPRCMDAERILFNLMSRTEHFHNCHNFSSIVEIISDTNRSTYDKLPREFESIIMSFSGLMSFRGWRDLQRMGFCAHKRSRLNPHYGFYKYDKPAPDGLEPVFNKAWNINNSVFELLMANEVPIPLAEYHMALGNKVAYWMSGNLRQLEFCNWQRTKPSVNHEVRQIFLFFENALRDSYPWWHKLSRADVTPTYIFARGTAVPLS